MITTIRNFNFRSEDLEALERMATVEDVNLYQYCLFHKASEGFWNIVRSYIEGGYIEDLLMYDQTVALAQMMQLLKSILTNMDERSHLEISAELNEQWRALNNIYVEYTKLLTKMMLSDEDNNEKCIDGISLLSRKATKVIQTIEDMYVDWSIDSDPYI